jgi:membrane-associated protease RseP (regulator of RpoE activity)
MNCKALTFVVFATALAIVGIPGASSAQPGSAPFVLYGEEPWGGSYLGVDTQDVTAERLGALHLKDERGVEITMVDQDAPAGKAGLKEHDVILSINDQQVQSVEQLRRLIREVPPGRVISIGISRGGQPMTVRAQLAQRDKMPNFDFNFNPVINVPTVHIPPINVPADIDVPNIVVVHAPRSSGIMIENLTPQLAEFFGAKGGNGVLVRSVEKGSRAEQAGMRAGDVIVKINGSAVNDCSDFSRLLRSRSAPKASVTVLRDRKEQVLTLNFPEPKRSGSVYNNCRQHASEANCVNEDDETEVATVMPAITADVRRYQPDLEKLRKQVQEEVQRQRPQLEKMQRELQKKLKDNQGELKKEMEELQKDLNKQSEEIRKEWQHFQKKASEI